MQNAERNIEDKLAALHALYHRQRQEAITTEFWMSVVGFEALSNRPPDRDAPQKFKDRPALR